MKRFALLRAHQPGALTTTLSRVLFMIRLYTVMVRECIVSAHAVIRDVHVTSTTSHVFNNSKAF